MRNVSCIVLFNDHGKVLLQKRDLNTKREPGKWGFFGGGIENDETSTEAVIRECYEELTYILSDPKLVFKFEYTEGFFQYLFCEKYDENQKLIQCEGEAMNWFEKNQIKKLDMISWDKDVLLKVWNKLE